LHGLPYYAAFFFQVKINTNAEETQPGKNVELTVEAKPNSYVGILGVDQSVLLLKSGNDITEVNGKTAVRFSVNFVKNVQIYITFQSQAIFWCFLLAVL
jgi:hypothetical protein